jgi:hypothetical protein
LIIHAEIKRFFVDDDDDEMVFEMSAVGMENMNILACLSLLSDCREKKLVCG